MGRPEFRVTNALRQKVMLASAAGVSDDDIARAVGCSDVTLRKHFREELKTGRARKMVENLVRLERAAKKGNVTAMKHLDQKMQVAGADDRVRRGKPEPEGKKERQRREADRVAEGERYPVPQGPMLAVDNSN